MARATAELGATFLLCCAREVDFYAKTFKSCVPGCSPPRERPIPHRPEGAMIGFGRIGRALVDLMRGFEI